MMPRSLVSLIVATGLCVTAALAQEPPKVAEDASWRSAVSDQMCALEVVNSPNDVVFSMRDHPDGMALRGSLIEEFEFDPDKVPTIALKFGEHLVYLSAPQEVIEAQAQRASAGMFDADQIDERMALVLENNEYELPQQGHAEASSEFRACRQMRLRNNGPRGPLFVEFTGLEKLTQAARRMGMLSQVLGYTLTIDEQGKPSDCEFSRRFRRRAVEIAMCRPLLEHMRFEPAIDAEGNPTTGTYSNTIDFNMWMTQRGNLEREAR